MTSILDITKFIMSGSIFTFKLFIITAIFAIPLGTASALGKLSHLKILKGFLEAYTWVFRGTPLLLQVFFIYFGLPIFGIKLTPLVAASLAFIFNYGAYLTEVFRSGIQSIDIGQYEASKALGLNYKQTMLSIIIPQAIPRVLPPTCNEAINLIKDTALVSVIGIGEISRAAKEIVTRDFTITPFIIAAIVYLLITSIIVFIFKCLEREFALKN